MSDDLYATTEELNALRLVAKSLGRAWDVEITQAMRGERMFRSRYLRVRDVLERATAALKGHGTKEQP